MNLEKIEEKSRNLDRFISELQDIRLLVKELNRVEKEIEDGKEPEFPFGISFYNSKYINQECKFALNGSTAYLDTASTIIILVRNAVTERQKDIEEIINEEYGGISIE